uniref:Si:dkeyp-77h1.4 n=1 Tax=Gouania willdenowi TaxID=441366 RepID=A0A8C5HF21_GOUWI
MVIFPTFFCLVFLPKNIHQLYVLSSTIKVCPSYYDLDDEDSLTLFLREDLHIQLPSLTVEVMFRNQSAYNSPEVVLMRGATTINPRVKLNRKLSHLVVESVGEGDEGVYTLRNPDTPEDVKRIRLIVRDCTNEQIIKYGDNYHIPLTGIIGPITVEYRPLAVEANQTSKPALVVLTTTETSPEAYRGRISVSERYVTLKTVTGADEGSYTIWDNKGLIQRKECLNVKEHHNFVTLQFGKRLKINLILSKALVHLYYTPSSDLTPRLLMENGEISSLQVQTELGLQDRLSLDGSVVYLDQVKSSDAGQFKITDMRGFTVSTVHLVLERLLYVAIIALSVLLAFLLLVCLLSCLIKIKKEPRDLQLWKKIAQNAGKEDEGEAFRQVRGIQAFQADTTEKSQSTEVDIKGLEVSSKEVGVGNLETSDSGVGFNTALPLDTDTDATDQIPDSEDATISAPEPMPTPSPAADSKPSAPPATDNKHSPVYKAKVSPAPETKKTPDQPSDVKLDVPKTADVKLSPASSPEPKAGLSPAEPKPQAPSPSPELKPASPKAPTSTPVSKSPLNPKPEPLKPTHTRTHHQRYTRTRCGFKTRLCS